MKLTCHICENSNIEFIFKFNETFSYYKCPNCGFLTRNPDTLSIDYVNDYMDESALFRSRILANNYFKRLKSIITDKSECLEIGGSFGFFCSLLQNKKKCLTRNVELSNFASKFSNSNGIKTFNQIEDLDIKQFDYIFLFHVVEHIEPPLLKNFVGVLLNLLKENGKLIIFTPDADSFKFKIFNKSFPWLAYDEHIGFLSKDSVRYLTPDITNFKIQVKSEIPSWIHYPLNSIFGFLRKKLIKVKVNNLISESNTNQKFNFKNFIIIRLKSAFNLIMLIERIFVFPMYLIFDKFFKPHDELVVLISKNNFKKID